MEPNGDLWRLTQFLIEPHLSSSMDGNIHQRVLKLRDAALGSRKSVSVSSALARVSYECVVDSLLTLYSECSSEQAGLARDKNVARFLSKYGEAVKSLNELRLTAQDFSVKAIIGRGHFGEVQVVHEKSTGDVYAMKVMKKSHILQQADAAFFLEERDIMAWATSPWLTSLHYAFQDSTHLYLVMDFHPGGDLLTVMERNEGGMGETDARFYLSEIAMGLHDLHKLGFVHRDVKPENVLITRSGHIKLVDFGSAARLGLEGKVLESRLPVGTPEYIAPEVLTSLDRTADYGVCCDWWSLGIIAFELVCDVTPFTGKSTTETYGNIMNYKKSLKFVDGVEMSEELRDLISQLLTDPASRIGFSDLQTHAFFSSTDWENLLQTIPPYIPTVSTPDDTTNFEEYEPQKDTGEELFLTPSTRAQKGFSGQGLPFVGFTFTRMDSVKLDLTDSKNQGSGVALVRRESGRRSRGRGGGRGGQRGEGGGEQDVMEMRKLLEASQKEMRELKERKASLERECVIYQSQLEDYHRKLEIEKVDRRQSDCQALQLLEEVREQGKIAQQLRESEANTTCEQLNKVIEQLEQDRAVASKRARRLQDELQKMQQERDAALKKISDYKAKVTDVKQSSRRDVASLQTKLAKVTKDSLAKAAEMQDRLTEAHARFAESSKRVQEVESERRKLEFSLQQAQLDGSISSSEAAKDLSKRLEEAENARTGAEKTATDFKHQLEVKEQENSSLHAQCRQLSQQVKELEGQWQATNSRQEQLEAEEWELKRQLGAVGREKEEAVAAKGHAQEKLKKLERLVGDLRSDKQALEDQVTSLRRSSTGNRVVVKREVEEAEGEGPQAQLEATSRELQEMHSQLETLKRDKEASNQLREELRSLQAQLSETSNLYIAQGDKLREVRRSRMELDQENTNLKMALNKSKAEGKKWEKKFHSATEELAGLAQLREKVKGLQRETKSLINSNKNMKRDLELAQSEKEEAVLMRREAEASLRDKKKEMEAQELNAALLQKNLQSVEEELKEVRGTMEEGVGKEVEWKASQENLQTDLEGMETRLESAFQDLEKEKSMRATLEQQLSDTMSSLEKTAAAHSEEQRRLVDQLATQKQLASKYSERVLELEKEGKLKQLELREAKKELETERSLSSKLYDDLHSLSREHGKLKAAHLKMLQDVEQREAQLSQESAARERAMEEQREATAAHMIQETRMQATIAQQIKLIDFLQNASPPSRSRLKLKGFKLSRKARDPAKERAEWKKIKGLVGKPHKSGVAESSGPTVSLRRATSSSSQLSLASVTSSTSQSIPSIVHLPPAKDSSPHAPEVTQYFTVRTTEEMATSGVSPHPAVREFSVDIQRQRKEQKIPEAQSLAATPQSAGKKRVMEAAAVSTPSHSSQLGIEHNIPHKFALKSAPLHKSYTCASCKTTIKAMQKFVKCNYCGLACHPKCSAHMPNTCGLPAELVDFDFSQPSSAKRARIEVEGEGEGEEEAEGIKKEVMEEGGADDSGKKEQPRTGSSSMFRKPEATIKFGRVHVPKGEVKSECWLMLTQSSLKCYDRHPSGINRKPLNSFSFNSPNSLVVVLPNIDSRPMPYMSPAKYQHLLFGMEEHSVSGVKQAVFVANSLEEKEEWVAAIGAAVMGKGEAGEGRQQSKKSPKSVPVTPVRSSQRLAGRAAKVSSPDSASVV